MNIEPPRTNRATLSFWTYVGNLGNMQAANQMVNFVVGNHFVVSVEAASANSVNLMCTMYEKLNRQYGIGTQTNTNSLVTINATYNIPYNKITLSSLNYQWFYTRCAMSYDQALYYLKGRSNGVDTYVIPGPESSLPLETLYTGISNDVYFRTIYRNGDTMPFQINNASATQTQFYVKNLYIFREYIPYNMYFEY